MCKYSKNMVFVVTALFAPVVVIGQTNSNPGCGTIPEFDCWSGPYSMWIDMTSSPPAVKRPIVPTGIVTLHKLTHKIPGKAAKEYERGVKAEFKGDRETAIVHLGKAAELDPEYWEALNDLGVNLVMVNKFDQGIEQLSRAVKVDPRSAMSYSNLSAAYFKQQRYTDAELVARQAVRLDPAGDLGAFLLGESLVAQNKYSSEATDNLKKAVKSYADAGVALALVLAKRGDVEGAKNQVRAYLATGDTIERDTAKQLLQQLEPKAPPPK